jgi:hypothetical protein
MPRTAKALDPRQLASKEVDEYFERIFDTREVFTQGSIYAPCLDDAFARVKDALVAEHVGEHGEEEDMDAWHETFAMEPGDLIGIRIGARLSGGAR